MRATKQGLFVLCSGILGVALAVGCGGGGGGGGGGSGGAEISGTLNKGNNIQTASLGRGHALFARLASWLGASRAVAQATTNCGHVEEAANNVPVALLLNGAVVQTTATNGDGHFRFADLAPGDYVIQLSLPSGVISAPVIVQPGQVTDLTGELDVDCHDVDHDGTTTELELSLHEDTEDGSSLDADETEDGGDFDGQVHQPNGRTKHEHGNKGNRSDESDSED